MYIPLLRGGGIVIHTTCNYLYTLTHMKLNDTTRIAQYHVYRAFIQNICTHWFHLYKMLVPTLYIRIGS